MPKVQIPIDKVDGTEPLRAIWEAVDGYEPVRNAFMHAAINKFAFTIITSKEWLDPWSFTERGFLEYGETIEELFINIAKVTRFDPEQAPQRELKRTPADIRSLFYSMNYQKQYPASVSRAQWAQAFLSYQGVTDMIAAVVASLYTAMEYDKFLTKKFMLATMVSKMGIPRRYQAAITNEATAKAAVVDLRKTVKDFGFYSPDNNPKRVYNSDVPDDIFIICDTAHEAYIDVMVDAQAFHLDKVDWTGRVMVVDSFTKFDTKRLYELFGEESPDMFTIDATTGEITVNDLDMDVLAALNFLVITRNTMQCYVNLREIDSEYVRSGKYYNYWLDNWMTFGVSLFSQMCAFIGGTEPATTTLAITTDLTAVPKGSIAQLAATLTVGSDATADAPADWWIEGGTSARTQVLNGMLYVGADETAATLTVHAQSVAYPEAMAQATATITTGATDDDEGGEGGGGASSH